MEVLFTIVLEPNCIYRGAEESEEALAQSRLGNEKERVEILTIVNCLAL